MSLLNSTKQSYKPFEYQWAFDAWQAQQRMHWLPEEVPMNEDVFDFHHSLTTDEREVVTDILRFFTQADIDVEQCYVKNYMRFFKPNEVQMMLISFASMETVHIQAYSYLLETLGLDEKEYSAFLEIPCMMKKHEEGTKVWSDSPVDLLKGLAVYGGFVEGLQLFGSFSVLMNFQRFGLLKGLGQIVTWSVRDESLHANSMIRLYHELKKELGINVDDSIKYLSKLFLQNELEFLDYVFRGEREIRGVKLHEIKGYMFAIYNMRCKELGISTPFESESAKELDYMTDALANIEKANFFSVRSTEYSKNNLTGSWKEGFESIENEV